MGNSTYGVQAALCSFQAARWHSLEQYRAVRHRWQTSSFAAPCSRSWALAQTQHFSASLIFFSNISAMDGP